MLVLMPGTQGGAGDFTLLARDLTKRVDDLQVWAIDRRSQVLEDTAMFASGRSGEITLQQMFDYYLGWIGNGGSPADHFDFLDAETVPVRPRMGHGGRPRGRPQGGPRCRQGGPARSILGGHSLGASLTAAYAAWDFNGKPGFEDVDGLVLIDGGLLGSFDAFDLAQAQEQIADLESGNPFLDLLGIGIPEAAGLFAEVGGMFARLQPTASAGDALQEFALLPDEFKPPVPDDEPRPAGLRLRSRHLARLRSASCTSTPAASPRPATRATGATAASPRSTGSPRPSARSRATRSSGISRSG